MNHRLTLVVLAMLVCVGPALAQENDKKDNFGGPRMGIRFNGGPRGGGMRMDKSSDAGLQALLKECVDKFQQLQYIDEQTGDTMAYNLCMPDGYDPGKQYPIVLFIGDASTVSNDPKAPLTQGWGGLVWASSESQAKHPCFVLVPQYKTVTVDDSFNTSSEVEETIRLLEHVCSAYPVDTKRMYKTGQSMGGMISFHFSITHPDLFAASLFVGSQWDTSKMQHFTDQRFFYVVAEGDSKASKGMADLKAVLDAQGATYVAAHWNAKAEQAEQEANVQQMVKQGCNNNFVIFDMGSVMPDGKAGGNEHMQSFDYAYKIAAIRDWLFQQSK